MPQPKGKPLTEKQKAALRKGAIKKGEVRNPTGTNALSRARAKIAAEVAKDGPELYRALKKSALEGDTGAGKELLRALLPTMPTEIKHSGDITMGWTGDKPKRARPKATRDTPKRNGKDTGEALH